MPPRSLPTMLPVAPLALALAIGLGAILGAWAFELVGGYVPCELCLQQRIPYYVGLPLMLAGLVLARRATGAARILAGLGGVALLVSAGIGGYQAGAEWGFWPGPTDCGGGTGPVTDATNLLAQLQSTRLVSCTETSLRVLGLSFAGWNVVAAGASGLLALAAALLPARR